VLECRRSTQGCRAAAIQNSATTLIEQRSALEQRIDIAGKAVPGAEILPDPAVQRLGPEMTSGPRIEEPRPPNLLDILQEQIAPAVLPRLFPHMPGSQHGSGRGPERLVGRIPDVGLH